MIGCDNAANVLEGSSHRCRRLREPSAAASSVTYKSIEVLGPSCHPG